MYIYNVPINALSYIYIFNNTCNVYNVPINVLSAHTKKSPCFCVSLSDWLIGMDDLLLNSLNLLSWDET